MLYPEEPSRKRKGSNGEDSGDDEHVVGLNANYPDMTFELSAQRSLVAGGKTYRLVASGKIGKVTGDPMWTDNGALHVSLLRVKPVGRKTGERFVDHTTRDVAPYAGEVKLYGDFADEVIAKCDAEKLSTIVVNCKSGQLRSSILCCAIYMRLAAVDAKTAMAAMKASRAALETTLEKPMKHCVGAALGRASK